MRKALFATIDKLVPKNEDCWLFPVYFIGNGDFVDNSLAVFENIKNDRRIKKVVLYRDNPIQIDGKNIELLRMTSYRAAWAMLRAKVIFVQHSIWLDFSKAKFQISHFNGRLVVNLWHGIPFKDISHSNTGIHTPRGLKEMPYYRILTSSARDTENMRKAFHRAAPNNFWETGLPRNDFLSLPEDRLPQNLREMLRKLDSLLAGKRLVLYAPTYRETNVGGYYYEFAAEEVEAIESICERHNCMLGVRYHIYRRPQSYRQLTHSRYILDLSEEVIGDVRMIMRRASLLITDYSSIVADAIHLDIPYLSFAYDLISYEQNQRGFFYPYARLFPLICQDAKSIFESMDRFLSGAILDQATAEARTELKEELYAFCDTDNARRVVERIRAELSTHDRMPGVPD
jgi:CDP-glycerol glycerophosphotransferase